MTIRQAINSLDGVCLKQHAQWAVGHVLGLDYTQLILKQDEDISKDDETKLDKIKERLENNEPIQYIIGTLQFVDLTIKTDKRALIPRQETELLAIQALECANIFEAPKILDIGCGTGCIGLFLKSRLPKADVEMMDLSDDALGLTGENMNALGLSCTLTKSDMLALETLSCDIIVSNPPYIRTDEIKDMDANVKDYEPYTALNGGYDGLIFYRALSEFANNSLSEDGAILVETGYNLHEAVADIFRPYFKNITILKDFMDIYRVVIAKR